MDFEQVKFKAIKYLGISKKTKYEVITKLKNSNFDEKIINNVIDYLIEIHYIDDVDYVDSYIRQNERMQKYSIYELSEKLKIKGIDTKLLEDKMDTLEYSNYEKAVIEKIVRVKSKLMDDEKIKQYLYRRGFKRK